MSGETTDAERRLRYANALHGAGYIADIGPVLADVMAVADGRTLEDAAARQRKLHDTQRPHFHAGLPCKPEFDCGVARPTTTC